MKDWLIFISFIFLSIAVYHCQAQIIRLSFFLCGDKWLDNVRPKFLRRLYKWIVY